MSAGAPFNVYLRNNLHSDNASTLGMVVATYVVKAGDTLLEAFPLSLFKDGQYSIDVHGPNGFYRSYVGSADAPAVLVHTSYEQRGANLTGNVQVLMSNLGKEPITVTIQDNAYKTGAFLKTLRPGRQTPVVINLDKSHSWYDFDVKVAGSTARSRFAGRVETRRHGVTDPFMGGVV